MEHPVRVAFCPILFEANGGQFTSKGLPIIVKGVRGKCDRAYDCGQCPLLASWVNQRMSEGFRVGWECDFCVKQTKHTTRELPGFYQSGRKKYPTDHEDYDPDQPGLEGCTRCGFETSFLQLVLRKDEVPDG